MIIFKNVSGEEIYIDNLVQAGTPHDDDGKILDGQTLDFTLSFRPIAVSMDEEIGDLVKAGDLVFVISGVEKTVQESIIHWSKGVFFWAICDPTFRTMLAADNCYQSLQVMTLSNRTGDDRLDATAIKNLP